MGNRVDFRTLLPSSIGLILAAGVSLLLLFSCSRGLSTVSSIKATPNGTTLDLTWAVVSGISQYSVYLSQSSSVSPTSYTKVYTTDTNNISIPGLTLGGTYYLVIVPVALGGLASGPVSGVVKVLINGYVVTSITPSVSGSTLTLTWGAVSGVSQYAVYLSQSSSVSPTSYTSTYTSTSTSVTIPGLTVGTTYYFVVVPADSSGKALGPASSVASANINGYVYASNINSSLLPTLAVGTGGSLTSISGVGYSTQSSPTGVAVSPNNNFVYVANNGSNTISAFSVGANGALTSVPGSPFPSGSGNTGPLGLAVSPSGSYLYAANETSNTITGYSIASNGALTLVYTTPAGQVTTPYMIAITPGSGYLYVANYGANNVSAFQINSTTGALANLPTQPAGTNPWGAAVSPDGKELYIANCAANGKSGTTSISAFAIGSGGALTPLSTPQYTTGGLNGTNGIAISPDGKYLYAANTASGANSISGFSIGTGGALTALPGSPFAVGASPVEVAITHDSRYLYSSNAGGTVSAFAIGSNGALTAVSNGTTIVGSSAWGIAVSN